MFRRSARLAGRDVRTSEQVKEQKKEERRQTLLSSLDSCFDPTDLSKLPKHESPPTPLCLLGRLPLEVRQLLYRQHFTTFDGITIETDEITSKRHRHAVKTSGKHHYHLNLLRLNNTFHNEAMPAMVERLLASGMLHIHPNFNCGWDHHGKEPMQMMIDRRCGLGFDLRFWLQQPYQSTQQTGPAWFRDERPAIGLLRFVRKLSLFFDTERFGEHFGPMDRKWDTRRWLGGPLLPEAYNTEIKRFVNLEKVTITFICEVPTKATNGTAEVAFEPFAALASVKRYKIWLPHDPTLHETCMELRKTMSEILKRNGKGTLKRTGKKRDEVCDNVPLMFYERCWRSEM